MPFEYNLTHIVQGTYCNAPFVCPVQSSGSTTGPGRTFDYKADGRDRTDLPEPEPDQQRTLTLKPHK